MDYEVKQSFAEQANPPTEAEVEAVSTLWACVASEVGYGDYDTEESLEDKIGALEAAIAGKASTSHTHTATSITGLADVATTGMYTSLAGRPTLSTVATSGDYNDLSNKPTAYTHPTTHPASMITGLADVAVSGSYNDLTDKPTIPTMPTSLPANGGNADTVDGMHASEFAVMNHTHTQYATVTHGHAVSDIAGLTGELDGKADVSHTHNYAATTHTHTVADLTETSEKKVMTAAERAKLEGIEANANNYTHPATHAASMITGLATVATSGSYDDLSDKPTSMTPTAHTHAQSDITGLASSLSGKANASHSHAQSEVTGLSDALSGKANATHTHSDYAATSHTHAQSEVTGLVAALAGKANVTHSHEQADIMGLVDALAGKANASHAHTNYATTSHTHSAAELLAMAESMFSTNASGGVLHYYGEGSGKNILTEMASWSQGMHTAYSYGGTTGNPKDTESWRMFCHKTSDVIGWVLAFGTSGSVYSNYYDSGWKGWKTIYDALPAPLWTGEYYMTDTQTVTPSKTLSECAHGWMLLWSDYNPGDGVGNTDFATTIIPKRAYTGQKWGGGQFLCVVPRFADSSGEAIVVKTLAVHDTKLVGSANNTVSPRNDVVLRAVYEF